MHGLLRNDFDKAAGRLRSEHRLRFSRTTAAAYFNRGNVHIQRGDLDKAATADFDETPASDLDPGNIGALINRGNLHLRRGNVAAALADFDAALAVDPAFVPVYLNRAAARQEQGDNGGERLADYAEDVAAT